MTQVNLCWGAKVPRSFALRVITAGQDFDMDPNWFMACMAFETGRTFSPSVKNPNSSATGLIQFMWSTAQEYGTSPALLALMSQDKQFDYVWLYFRDAIKAHGPLTSLADCYMAILNPVAIGKPMDYEMWVKGSSAYAANAGLDANKDHKITKAEAAARVAEMLTEGLLPPNNVYISADTPQPAPVPVAPQPPKEPVPMSFLSKFVFNPILAEIARGFTSSNPAMQATATAASPSATSTALVVPTDAPVTGSPNSPIGQTNPLIQQLEDDLNNAVAAFVQATVVAEVPVVGVMVAPKAAELTKTVLQFAENHALSYVAGLFHFHINTQPTVVAPSAQASAPVVAPAPAPVAPAPAPAPQPFLQS